MSKYNVLLIAILFSISGVTNAANVFSGCFKVKAVVDSRAYSVSKSIYLLTSPAIPGCQTSNRDRVRVMSGNNGATADTENAAITLGTSALLSGKEIEVYYDNSTSNCDVQIIALGGNEGQCN